MVKSRNKVRFFQPPERKYGDKLFSVILASFANYGQIKVARAPSFSAKREKKNAIAASHSLVSASR